MIDIHHGDCRQVMATLDAASVDAIVCDPPYGLSFMGKEWDSFKPGDIAMRRNPAMDAVNAGASRQGGRQRACSDYQKRQRRDMLAFQEAMESVFLEALRVAKPGAHLLAFGGTRTYHRLACAIEDAGWEIRDCVMWVYGSGFPKSLNVSKAVEKLGPQHDSLLPDEQRFCDWMRESSGLEALTVKRLTGSARFITGEVEIVNTATTENPRWGRRAMVPTAAAWEKLVAAMSLTPPEWVSALVKEPPSPPITHPGEWKSGKGEGTSGSNEWQGWGTALKPAWEPIIVARKPLVGNVAENVLTHGTGAINVDGCRVGNDGGRCRAGHSASGKSGPGSFTIYTSQAPHVDGLGRWPANLIHDGSEEVTGLLGDAARFFYCPKASKADRDEGCEGMEEKENASKNYGTKAANLTRKDGGENVVLPRRNNHPTVKPTDLMRYLCRLVTPPGGIVLDPFTGSGSTGKAAVLEGFSFIGIEREAEYVEMARARIAPKIDRQRTLFS